MMSRLLCSPTLQRLYAPLRRMPLVGEIAHGLVGKLLPQGTRVPVRVRAGAGAGLLLSVDPRYESLYAAGDYEEPLLNVLAAHLGRGDVLYDVGAHIGFVSLVAARVVGPAGAVYAFEADEDNAKRIAEHKEMNSLPQLEVVPAAAWSERTKLSFRRSPDASSRNTGSVAGISASEGALGTSVVDAVTLDEFARAHRAANVVKIDVEGAEEEVLAGSETVLRTSRPALICEIHNARAAEAVANRLAACGYAWNWLDDADRFPRHLVAEARR